MPSLPLSVVVPAFNEEKRLPSTLVKVEAFLAQAGIPHELLVVDDGSTDATDAAATNAVAVTRVLRHPVNRGKGAAVRTGVLASCGETVLITDADLSTPIEDLIQLQRELSRGEVVIGSRALRESRVGVHQPFYRELMGKVFNRLLWLLGLRGLWDTQCGFKLLDGAIARSLFTEMQLDGFAWDVELVWRARQAGYRVLEVPVRWDNDQDTRVSPLGSSLEMLRDVLWLRWHLGAPRSSRPRA